VKELTKTKKKLRKAWNPSAEGDSRPYRHGDSRSKIHGDSRSQTHGDSRSQTNGDSRSQVHEESRSQTHTGTYIEGYESDAQRYKRERNEWKQKCATLEQLNSANRDAITQLHNELEKQQKRVDQTKRSAHEMQTHLDNKELFLGYQASDDEVRTRFNSLINSLKTWSTKFATGGSGLRGEFSEESILTYQRVAPGCSTIPQLEKLLSNGKKKRLFTRGLAGYVMSDTLFRTLATQSHEGNDAHDVWLDKSARRSVQRLEDRLYQTGRLLQFLYAIEICG
jgi:hypothetical protein